MQSRRNFWRLAGFAITSRRFRRHIIGESTATQKSLIAATSGPSPVQLAATAKAEE
jgi:hypothetical protein